MQQEALKGDEYQALIKMGTDTYKEKGSKFIAYAFPAKSLADVEAHLDNLKKEYHDARHFCYAYRLNPEQPLIRANDDGEPSNSAGIPIFNQLQSFDVWNGLVVVVRYFGGTKLGVGGLVQAYKEAARLALENAIIKKSFLKYVFEIQYPYSITADVMRIIKDEKIEILEEQMGMLAGYKLAIKRGMKNAIFERLDTLYQLKKINPND